MIEIDGNAQTWELGAIVDGITNPDRIQVAQNTITVLPNEATDPAEHFTLVTQNPLQDSEHAQTVTAGSNFGGTPDLFLDWAVDVSALSGYVPGMVTRFACGAGSSSTTPVGQESIGTALNLDKQFSDTFVCDGDGCLVESEIPPNNPLPPGANAGADQTHLACAAPRARPTFT